MESNLSKAKRLIPGSFYDVQRLGSTPAARNGINAGLGSEGASQLKKQNQLA